VLFGAVWGGLPLADAVTGHPGVSHAQFDANAGAQLVGADSTCTLCDLLATPVVATVSWALTPVASTTRGVSAVTKSEPSVAANFRPDAARPPPAL
jgi:hypothetical protein